MQDQYTSVAELKAAIADFAAARDWQPFHTGKNLAMSIAIEAAELMEHFQWSPPAPEAVDQAAVAEELADVLMYALAFANSLDIDVAAAIRAKLAKNETRFPVSAGKASDNKTV
ncbi:nucleotide pyrophosphohydrolase [Chitinimonas taiwanensis]|jgi:NTP pyrophosphatase (non-canonical NTP hydrolase)|uniref:NTP pyrophosphatase, house-cleaning of non-canonical NTPs n=1 Tax=Chitinimonas taiwanensis DSM 18899 TaxID=1121279 RepID=A0A1K2HQ84_9NEIS|nr:nucleotide pyrophosphohydrolase [Chitinimonas taiwanensis]SFZ78972.1 NTP pyrophosphatase, house-cleaning of non-canonical NTPs [Chitinimonas taiwanensis DSM 18899]